MRQYTSKTLNIPRLLALGDLDIRGFAEANPRVYAGEYFSNVERFIENSANFAGILTDASDYEQLITLKILLTCIGYEQLNPDIEAIINEIRSGQPAQAKKRAEEIFPYFRELCERLKSAYTPKKRNKQIQEETTWMDEPGSDIALDEALEYLDYAESHRKLRILAVDDVAVVLNTLTSILSPHYEVFALTKASQVEKFLTYTTPELFLLDIEMPELSGYDLLSVIRSFPEHKNTPIIFLTGNATIENLKTAVSLGACDFITKPVNRDILLEKIEGNIVWKKAF